MAVETTPRIALHDPDYFEDGIPHDAFDWLREHDPVHWHEHPDGGGFWVVTRAEDVAAVSRDADTFSSNLKGVFLEEDSVLPLEFVQESTLLYMDAPQHTRMRRIISRRFTPRRVADLEPRVRAITAQVIDDVIERGECEFVEDVAGRLPMAMICELMGVPAEDRARAYHWANAIAAFDDPSFRGDPDDGLIAFEEAFLYANELAEARAEEPTDDLISALVQADVEGEALTELELAMFFLMLAVAGNETTKHTTSHGMHALIEHPEQHQLLLADPSRVPNAVEEILRWGSVVNYFRRTARADTCLGDRAIAEGDRVTIWYPAANRDPGVFADPHTFDVCRVFDGQYAFGGGGPHFCLGAALARMQLKVMFEELLARLPDVELAGPVVRLRSNWMNGIKQMPIRFTPGDRRGA